MRYAYVHRVALSDALGWELEGDSLRRVLTEHAMSDFSLHERGDLVDVAVSSDGRDFITVIILEEDR